MADYAKETRDRAETERERLAGQLAIAVTAMQAAIDRLSATIREHYNKVAEIDRLRVHVKENLLYYMQSIWSHEPPDQRYFRLFDVDVPDIAIDTAGQRAPVTADSSVWEALRGEGLSVALPVPNADVSTKMLVEVADLDTVLGYKGNYTTFPLRENSEIARAGEQHAGATDHGTATVANRQANRQAKRHAPRLHCAWHLPDRCQGGRAQRP